MKKFNTKIRLSEVLNELDKHRRKIPANKFEPTEEQKLFIAISRDGKPTSSKIFYELWEKMGWEKVNRNTILRYYKKHKDELTKLAKQYRSKKNGHITNS